MRHGTSNRRNRNRNSGRRNNQNRNQVFDSNGPDVRIRGTAHQVAEKYLALAKDSSSAGDHTMAENYYQHAEHYIRIINEMGGAQEASKVKGLNSNVAENEGNRVDEREDDLSLPTSILGPEVRVESTKETRVVETAD
ncbi:MAG: DUF4167 domain-containing protein [Alphaproteobacteria bacterium]|nr:DUF4167 domain-containing protein [Alphaproteobacteria bacterium]